MARNIGESEFGSLRHEATVAYVIFRMGSSVTITSNRRYRIVKAWIKWAGLIAEMFGDCDLNRRVKTRACAGFRLQAMQHFEQLRISARIWSEKGASVGDGT